MRLLLDTQAIVWWLEDDPRLSARAAEAIARAGTDAVVSAASVWELAIKRAAGKYPGDDLLGPAEAAGFTILTITGAHGKLAGELPLHHRDPFDRVIVAQAIIEDRVLVTSDAVLARYGVPVIW
ncbi:MAG: type II toxin-antitoxin system VapC family toxin [Patulibacter sp.]|nr:type II toxin-antitoxin system VapC family toxin [Patulibacter sp.]